MLARFHTLNYCRRPRPEVSSASRSRPWERSEVPLLGTGLEGGLHSLGIQVLVSQNRAVR